MRPDVSTWYGHALLAVALPVLALPLPGDPGRNMVAVSVLTLLAFMLRERRDWKRKVAAGTASERWWVDGAGDLLGPVTACACYLVGWVA